MKLLRFLFIVPFFALASCNDNAKPTQEHRYTVRPEIIQKTLAFSGTVKPLAETTLTSPIDGVIEHMGFHYGQLIRKDEVVVTLNSNELQRQYNENLTEYLKAKDNYNVAKAKFSGTEDLWQAGLISKNNYLSEKSSLDTSHMALMQATSKLAEILDKMDAGKNDFTQLNLSEFDKVRQALTINHNLIHLKAPTTGLFLYPPKSSNDSNAELGVGTAVKAGQVIGLIGDMSGISIEIEIPEIDIGKIHPGMQATITGIAFATEPLQGELVAVNSEAVNNSSSLPYFHAVVEVKHLSQAQQQLIKVGMSAAIELKIDQEKQLLVPIAAVKLEKGANVVQLQAKNGQLMTKNVATGSTQMDKVAILNGLQEGDIVVYD